MLEALAELPDESVDCVVTSPPYWGLRDYGTGEWEGGDQGCDHTGPPKASERSGLKNDGRPPGLVGQNNYERHATVPYRDSCGKCGARRVDRQLGLEPTPDLYVARMVEVFRQVRRVLAPHGTCWVNLGDSYSGDKTGGRNDTERIGTPHPDALSSPNPVTASGSKYATGNKARKVTGSTPGLKQKDLVGIPWRVAFALQAAGWYLRSDIIWAKPNPMPESVTDRPTKSHEYVFLLTKGPRYWFDQEAVREPAEWARWGDQTNGKHEGSGSAAGWIQSRPKHELQRPQARRAMELFEQAGLTEDHVRAIRAVGITDTGKATVTQDGTGKSDPRLIALAQEAKDALGGYYREFLVPNGRNIRSVWEIPTQPYPEAHFATFPEELARRCIAAGAPLQVCRVCGKPRERIVGRETQPQAYEDRKYDRSDPKFATKRNMGARYQAQLDANPMQTIGWSDCGHNAYRPGVVLDPFLGSGTTALVARRLERHSIGIELNREYAELAARRLQQLSLFA